MSPEFNIIAAMSENRVIGKDGKVPWHIREDLRRFKELTTGHTIIMGRKTFESIGRYLPDRKNIVVSGDEGFIASGCIIAHSLEEALVIAKALEKKDGKIFVIGGGQIFNQSISLADRLYLTVIEGEIEGDVFFPDYSEFGRTIAEKVGESGGHKYKFLELVR